MPRGVLYFQVAEDGLHITEIPHVGYAEVDLYSCWNEVMGLLLCFIIGAHAAK